MEVIIIETQFVYIITIGLQFVKGSFGAYKKAKPQSHCQMEPFSPPLLYCRLLQGLMVGPVTRDRPENGETYSTYKVCNRFCFLTLKNTVRGHHTGETAMCSTQFIKDNCQKMVFTSSCSTTVFFS